MKKFKIALIIALCVTILPVVSCLGYELFLSIDSWYYTNIEKHSFLGNQYETIWKTEDSTFNLHVLSPEERCGDGNEPIVGVYVYGNRTLDIAMYMSSNGGTGTWYEYGVYAEEMYKYMVEVENVDLQAKPYGDEGVLANVLVEYKDSDEITITVTKTFREIFEVGDTFIFYRVDGSSQTE